MKAQLFDAGCRHVDREFLAMGVFGAKQFWADDFCVSLFVLLGEVGGD